MLKRDLQSITLKLSDLKEYDAKRLENKIKNQRPRQSVEPITGDDASTSGTTTSSFSGGNFTDTPSANTPTGSTTPTLPTEEDVADRPPRPTSVAATATTAATNSGSTDDDVSVAAVADDNDTIDELSDDNWVDLEPNDEDGARGGA
ncbi:uncharacterized protein LOC117580932 [Drosophila guanche]|uniref:Uncharacterized protein n=1 Tax=Drosophila guanche TaxID=7266 RepID=A0A3B0JDK3_DROGU|nr:uncharacterized protein LOC117580932 [Drosophila guanche]SPP78713.1 Hypothetical predicted protein [Drosophila guanche]